MNVETTAHGRSVNREAWRLVRGKGQFIADVQVPNCAYVAFARSHHPHGRIRNIRCDAAVNNADVIAVVTGDDFKAVIDAPSEFRLPHRQVLPTTWVHFQGEAVAAVLAATPDAARVAAEQIEIDLELLPVAGDAVQAAAPDAARVHTDFPSNVVIEKIITSGDADTAIAQASIRVRHSFRVHRGIGNPIEGRGILAAPDFTTEALNVWINSQIPFLIKSKLASLIGLPEALINVTVPDIGGGFGTKNGLGPEEIVTAWMALKFQRACRWNETWEEALLASSHGHDHFYDIEIGLDGHGLIAGVRGEIYVDIGAYSHWPWSAALEPIQAMGSLLGPYRVKNYRCRALGVITHKAPIGPLRGVARPSATFAFERMADKAAAAAGQDPLQWRRRNVVQPDEFPYRSATKLVYKKGSYVEAIDRLAEILDYSALREEQAQARANGRLVGVGVACSLELGGIGSAMPVAPGTGVRPGVEGVTVRLDLNGGVLVASGVPSIGQQPESMFVRIMQKELGAAPEQVSFIHDHVAAASFSGGVFAGRGAVIIGGAAAEAAALLRDKILTIAAHVLSTSLGDLTIEESVVRGSGARTLSFKNIAEIAYLNAHLLPPGLAPGLSVTQFFDPQFGVFANSAHGAVVEVDPDLFIVKIIRYAVVTDCGNRLNEEAVIGQILGGVAYGVSLALSERIIYDDRGYLIFPRNTSYPLARATEVPPVRLEFLSTPADSRTGAKPVGQSSTITTPAAIANAVADALQPLSIDVDTLPITPDALLGRRTDSARRTAR